MRIFAALLSVYLFLPLAAFAYPNETLNQCILGVKQNPIILGVPEKSIEDFCDCALTLIIDEGKGEKESGIECTSKSFG